jgi:hypothetical protein
MWSYVLRSQTHQSQTRLLFWPGQGRRLQMGMAAMGGMGGMGGATLSLPVSTIWRGNPESKHSLKCRPFPNTKACHSHSHSHNMSQPKMWKVRCVSKKKLKLDLLPRRLSGSSANLSHTLRRSGAQRFLHGIRFQKAAWGVLNLHPAPSMCPMIVHYVVCLLFTEYIHIYTSYIHINIFIYLLIMYR